MPFGVNSDPGFRAQKQSIRVRVWSFRQFAKTNLEKVGAGRKMTQVASLRNIRGPRIYMILHAMSISFLAQAQPQAREKKPKPQKLQKLQQLCHLHLRPQQHHLRLRLQCHLGGCPTRWRQPFCAYGFRSWRQTRWRQPFCACALRR